MKLLELAERNSGVGEEIRADVGAYRHMYQGSTLNVFATRCFLASLRQHVSRRVEKTQPNEAARSVFC